MSTRRVVREAQLSLFGRPKIRPRWKQFPAEVQQEATRLLALMLQEHVGRPECHGQKGGTADE
jgi:hypothetical protein